MEEKEKVNIRIYKDDYDLLMEVVKRKGFTNIAEVVDKLTFAFLDDISKIN